MVICFKLGVHMNAIFRHLARNENISFTFQAIQKPSAYLINLCYGVFRKIFGHFCVCLGENSFSQRICNFSKEIRNIKDLVKF